MPNTIGDEDPTQALEHVGSPRPRFAHQGDMTSRLERQVFKPTEPSQ